MAQQFVLTQEVVEGLIKRYATAAQAARSIGSSSHSINRAAKKFGLEFRQKGKRTV